MKTVSCCSARSGSDRIRGARLLLLACTALSPAAAAAGDLPTGGSVARGEVAISTPSSQRMDISQSSSRAVVNWQDFSVGRDAGVDIRQPSSKSAILNRVNGPATSQIHGSLRANGQVFVVNRNGVVVGPSGRVQTGGGFVASSLAIGNDDFMAGRLSFEGNGRSAPVSNEGLIEVGPGGYAALLGGRVSNSGNIVVPLGRVGLGAGERITLDLSGDSFLQVALPSEDDGGESALIEHAGAIAAEGGRVEISAATARNAARYAVNLSGVVEARSVSGRSGSLVLSGGQGGRVRVSGTMSTRPTATPETSPSPRPRPGGSITVTGAEIRLAGATIDASGDAGGTVRFGGDWQGGGTLPWSELTSVDAGSTIRADALGSGDGGSVVLWSGGATGFGGFISARGGAEGGDGGMAEVSGRQHLSFAGSVDLTAPAGATGTLLLDPINVLISNDPTSNNDSLATDDGPPPSEIDRLAIGTPSIINAGELSAQLSGSNVIVSTTDLSDPDDPPVGDAGNITVAAPLSWGTDNTLTLQAANDILLQAGIEADAGGLTINAGGDITTTSSGTVDVARFLFQAGNWSQALPVLPLFEADDFTIANDGAPGNPSFLRVTGGDGTPDSPYQITDVYGLQGIDSAGYHDDAFALADDIDAIVTSGWNGGAGFNPIGEIDEVIEGPFTPFSGSFDGLGNTISNLTVTGATAGVFGRTEGASVSNVNLVGVDVSGTEFVGSLIGDAVNTVVDRVRIDETSTVTGTVGTTDVSVGGLIGRLAQVEGASSLTHAVSSATVVEQGTLTDDSVLSTDVGGLVGFIDEGQVSAALAEGPVIASAAEGDGLLFRRIGGAVGRNDGSMSQVYARGPVTVTGDGISIDVGGLSGVVFGGSVVESFAAGALTAPADATVGGLIAADDIEIGSTGANSFWDIGATGVSTSEGGQGLTTAVMTSLTDFIAAAGSDWSFTEDWAPPDGTNRARLYAIEPVIWAVPEDVTEAYGDTATLVLPGAVFGGPDAYVFDTPGDSLPAPIFDSTGLPDGDVGIYPVTVPDPIFSTLGVAYDVVLSPADLEITPRPLTIIAALDASKTYGTEYQFTEDDFAAPNLANGDVLTPDILSSDGAAADAPVAGSPYDIDIDTTGSILDNYMVTAEPGLLTVLAAPLTIRADDASKTYGSEAAFDPAQDFTIVAGTLFDDDNVDSVDLASDGAPATATVADGPYVIEASNAVGLGLENYAITYQNEEDGGRLTVGRVPLTFAADPKSKTFGSPIPDLTGGYTGFVLGEGEGILTTSASLSTPAETGSPIGSYPISAIGPGVDGNYSIAYLGSTLSVTPAEVEPRPYPGRGGSEPQGADVIFDDPGGGFDAPTGAIRGGTEAASATLAVVQSYANGLEVDAAACRQSESQISDHLACISEALESFAASLEEIALDLPEELDGVAATIRRASSGVEAARTRAETRLATATTPEERAAIGEDAVAEARAALEGARSEIRIAIELIRAEDTDLARIEAATGGAILAALETVDIELVRATEL